MNIWTAILTGLFKIDIRHAAYVVTDICVRIVADSLFWLIGFVFGVSAARVGGVVPWHFWASMLAVVIILSALTTVIIGVVSGYEPDEPEEMTAQ